MAIYKSKKPTKDGRVYFFRIKYKDILGEVHDYTSPKFKNKKDAENEEARFRIKVNNKEAFISNITLDQAYQELLIEKKKKVKRQTVVKIENHYKHLEVLKTKKINDINLHNYKLFENILGEKDFCVAYKNKILELLRQIIKYSHKYYNTSDVLLKYIENFQEVNVMKKEMNFFTYEEYKKFDSVIFNNDWHTFFEVLYFLGLRQGEAQALNWKDIDFEKNTLTVSKTLTTKIKGEKWTISSPKTKSSNRTLPLTNDLINDLKSLKNNVKKYVDFSEEWFVFGNSIPFPETTIQKKKNNYCDIAKVKRIRVHDFRHSCASLLINKGASIALVSKYLGHSNIAITLNTYTHMYKSELEEMTNILNNL